MVLIAEILNTASSWSTWVTAPATERCKIVIRCHVGEPKPRWRNENANFKNYVERCVKSYGHPWKITVTGANAKCSNQGVIDRHSTECCLDIYACVKWDKCRVLNANFLDANLSANATAVCGQYKRTSHSGSIRSWMNTVIHVEKTICRFEQLLFRYLFGQRQSTRCEGVACNPWQSTWCPGACSQNGL